MRNGCNLFVVTSDTYSKFGNPMDRATCCLPGDAASDAWLSQGSGVIEFVFGTDGQGFKDFIITDGKYIHMDGKFVHGFMARIFPELTGQLVTTSFLLVE